MDIFRTLHFTSVLCTSFLSAHGTFTIGKHNLDIVKLIAFKGLQYIVCSPNKWLL